MSATITVAATPIMPSGCMAGKRPLPIAVRERLLHLLLPAVDVRVEDPVPGEDAHHRAMIMVVTHQ